MDHSEVLQAVAEPFELEIVLGSRAEEDGPLEGAAVQQSSQHAEQHGER
jgi:hypothetical protein